MTRKKFKQINQGQGLGQMDQMTKQRDQKTMKELRKRDQTRRREFKQIE